jgi:hypothetical protein
MHSTFASVRSLPWGRLLILIAAALAVASIAWPAQRAEAVDPVVFAIDCDMAHAGIQDDCTYATGTSTVDVGVYAIKSGGADTSLGALQFVVRAEQDKFDPPPDFDPGELDRNPDLSSAITSAGVWTCGPPDPNPDTNSDAMIADSALGCFESTFDPTPRLLGNGTPLLIMTVHYNVLTGDGSGVFTLNQGGISNHDASESYDCTTAPFVVPCNSATITIESDPYDTPGGHMAIDCDMGTPGIQDVCGVPMGTASTMAGVYLLKTGGGNDNLGSFDFLVDADEAVVDAPEMLDVSPFHDDNPDANNALFTSGIWACGPVNPVGDYAPADPNVVSSLLVCFESSGAQNGYVKDDGRPVLLGTITYAITAPTPTLTDLTLGGSATNDVGGSVVDCFSVPANCHNARLYVTGSLFDTDGDNRNNVIDNCIEAPNIGQENNDRIFDLPPTKMFDDATRPNSDKYGDVCDADDDNDGLKDYIEELGPPCASASGPTNPLLFDTDEDEILDGVECLLGSDPTVFASQPFNDAGQDPDNDLVPTWLEALLGSNPNVKDSDGDTVLDTFEIRAYGTDPTKADTDGDGCGDSREIASVNGDLSVGSIDLSQVAQTFGLASDPQYLAEFDMNKDLKSSAIDLSFIAQRFGNC